MAGTHAKAIFIESGLFNNMVVQRDTEKFANIKFSGKYPLPGNGTVYTRISGTSWKKSGTVKNRKLSACINKVSVGGPYDIDIRVVFRENSEIVSHVKNIYVGDVWLMAGQSNMAGDGLLIDAMPAHKSVMCFYMDDTWDYARDPLHCPGAAVDQIHHTLRGAAGPEGSRKSITRKRVKGVGCGISFANEMSKALNIPIGLIACAHGGSRLSQWLPQGKKYDGSSLYGALLRRVKKNSGRVAGIIWYQGESDAGNEDLALFQKQMGHFIKQIRRDLGNDKLPFIMAQIARVYYMESRQLNYKWSLVREQQRTLSQVIPNVVTVGTIDADMDNPIHVGANGQIRIGRRMALAAISLKKKGYALGGPMVSRAVFREDKRGPYLDVDFKGVNGRLDSDGAPNGFTIISASGWELPVYKTVLSGKKVKLYFLDNNPVTEDHFLYYGYGIRPYCNICDSKGLSVLGFGPYSLGKKQRWNSFRETKLILKRRRREM